MQGGFIYPKPGGSITSNRALIDSGSTIMPKDNSGKRPLDLAESSAMIKLLSNMGPWSTDI